MLKTSAPRTRGGKLAARACVCLVIGLGLLGIWSWSIDHYVSESQSLRKQWASVSGLVVNLRPDNRVESGAAQVSYKVDSRDYQESVDLGNDVENYRTGQQVVVYYDTKRPQHMTIDQVDNQPQGVIWLQVFAGLGGLVAAASGLMILIGVWRRRGEHSGLQGPQARSHGDSD